MPGPTPTFRDPMGVERPVPQRTAAETAAHHALRERAVATLAAEARRDPVAFAQQYGLEAEDVQRMLEGQRSFPDHLIALPPH